MNHAINISKEKFENVEIKKGKHSCNKLVRFKPFFKKTRLSYTVIFTDSCRYKFDYPESLELNRLFGLSYGFKNVVSFGWHHNHGVIQLFAYCIIDGKEKQCFVASLKLNTQYKLTLIKLNGRYSFVVTGKGMLKQRVILHERMCKICKWGWELFPSFGGKNTAPNDLFIMMHKNE